MKTAEDCSINELTIKEKEELIRKLQQEVQEEKSQKDTDDFKTLEVDTTNPIQTPSEPDNKNITKFVGIFLVLLIVIAILAVIFHSNSNSSNKTSNDAESYFDDNGDLVYSSESGINITTETLPATLKYNETEIKLNSVEFFEGYSDESYTYDLYTVIRLDVSACSDEQLHWLQEEDLEVRTYVTCEANDYDFDDLTNLGKILYPETKELVFVDMTSYLDENRKSFANSEVSVCIDLKQDETYKYEDTSLHCTNSVSYRTELEKTISNLDDISEPLKSQIGAWFTEDAIFYSNALSSEILE